MLSLDESVDLGNTVNSTNSSPLVPEDPCADWACGRTVQFEWGRRLGHGSYADVYIGWCVGSATLHAVKTVRMKRRVSKDECTKLLKEVGVMRRLGRHRSIVNCDGALFDPRGALCIVMEYMRGGALRTLVKTSPRLDAPIAAKVIKQVASGLAYLHKYKVYHRDLKGDNVLVSHVSPCGTPVVKIADFGNSKAKLGNTMASGFGGGGGNGGSIAATFAGTVLWMAPETIREETYSSSRADVWSLGVLACEVLQQGQTPWPPFESQFQLVYHIAQWHGGESGLDVPPNTPTDVSEDCKEFLSQCMRYDPAARPSANRLLSTSYIESAGEPSQWEPAPGAGGDVSGERVAKGYSVLYPVGSPAELHSLCLFAAAKEAQEAMAADSATSLTIQTLQTGNTLISPPATPPVMEAKRSAWDPNAG
eukprot:TRINITY_DN20437_c0_g1_i1.p1 TRINITY_DN20437_c0_g1~~TRINITY_DN20437_c0_g1_i1.p1  ORF type:complete len:430 (+),score=86.69 TRINITY_DN20437_c0_g1_i1:30-1292(+)